MPDPIATLFGGGIFGLSAKVFLLVFVVAACALTWRIKFIRRAIIFSVGIYPAGLLTVLGAFALVLWWPVSLLTDMLMRLVPLDRLVAYLLAAPSYFSPAPLIKGDRRTVAERLWTPNLYPDLYASTPEDLKRPPYEDGRLFGGRSLTWLSDRNLTDNALRSSIRTGVKAGVLSFLVILILQALGTLRSIFSIFPAIFSGNSPVVEQWPGDTPVKLSGFAVFSANIGPALSNLVKNLGALIIYIPTSAIIAAGVAIIIALYFLSSWLRRKAAPYELVTKDADVRWPYRIESRNLVHTTFRKQHAHATDYLKDSATFFVGKATGTLRVRGDLSAPMPNQPLKLDQESLFQHLLVFGGTGEGKTTGLLKPLMKQILVQQAAESATGRFGAFVTDAKGVLWHDAVIVAEKLGRTDDVVIVGTGDGAFGVNVVAGLTPSQIAATLRSVLSQLGTGGKDSFWPDMASSVLRHMLTIGKGFSQTELGAKKAAAGLNPYSLWWPYQAILRPELAAEAIEHIQARQKQFVERIKSAPTDDEARAILKDQKAFMTPELGDSITYIESAWRDMARETKTGIIANITQLLDGFASSAVLRERFACGLDRNTVSLREALEGKMILNTLSSIEDGLPARLVSILIKTSLYREARVREAEYKSGQYAHKPQSRPCLVVMDEVQELATVDPSSGLSDASFWNVARSTGLAGIFATQTVSALTQAMGDEAAANFIQQARSKVFFRTEEKETVDYACWCAGEHERNRVYEDGHRESIEYRALIDGWDPLGPVDESEEITADAMTFFRAARDLIMPNGDFGGASARPTYEVDTRFIASDPTPGPMGGAGGNAALMGSLQAAHWRAEDLTRDYRQRGNELVPAITASDIIRMGRWHAFAHVQRAGSVRQDIVAIEHDFS